MTQSTFDETSVVNSAFWTGGTSWFGAEGVSIALVSRSAAGPSTGPESGRDAGVDR